MKCLHCDGCGCRRCLSLAGEQGASVDELREARLKARMAELEALDECGIDGRPTCMQPETQDYDWCRACLLAMYRKRTAERDEARAEVERLRDLLEARTEVCIDLLATAARLREALHEAGCSTTSALAALTDSEPVAKWLAEHDAKVREEARVEMPRRQTGSPEGGGSIPPTAPTCDAVLVPRAVLEQVKEALHELRVSHQILDDMHCNDMLRRDTTSPADEKAWAALAALAALGE